jgi:hypothetical protein
MNAAAYVLLITMVGCVVILDPGCHLTSQLGPEDVYDTAPSNYPNNPAASAYPSTSHTHRSVCVDHLSSVVHSPSQIKTP